MSETTADAVNLPNPPKDEPTRKWLLLSMRQIVEIALDRVTNPKTLAADRIKWSRVLISAGQVTNGILRDVEIEELKRQVMELKDLTTERMKEDEDQDEIDSEGD